MLCPNCTKQMEKRIEKRSVASLISLFTDLLNEKQAKMMRDWMKHSHYCLEDYL